MPLTLIPTPIGNLEDITLRAVRYLKEVDYVLCEDTRVSGKLLKHLSIEKPLYPFHLHNEHKKLNGIIDELKAGKHIGLVSDAGTPAISDPGFLLVREALNQNIPVESLPGPTAFVPALIKSGFPTDRFVFEGFLPQKKGRKTRIEHIVEENRTVVLYESPYRVTKLLDSLKELDYDRKVSVSREITKMFEETITGTLEVVIEHFKHKPPKGEFVVVLEGKG
jgi:16S rRNA (cytidine1402-2'-O)-methyltransferase